MASTPQFDIKNESDLKKGRGLRVRDAFQRLCHGVEQKTPAGRVLYAVLEGDISDVARVLKKHNLPPDFAAGDFGISPLMLATIRGDAAMTTWLAQNPLVDVGRTTCLRNWTALHFAAQAEDESLVRILLRAGADPACKTVTGKIPADLTSSEAVRDLLQKEEARLARIFGRKVRPAIKKDIVEPKENVLYRRIYQNCLAKKEDPQSVFNALLAEVIENGDRPDVVRILLHIGADASANGKNNRHIFVTAIDKKRADSFEEIVLWAHFPREEDLRFSVCELSCLLASLVQKDPEKMKTEEKLISGFKIYKARRRMDGMSSAQLCEALRDALDKKNLADVMAACAEAYKTGIDKFPEQDVANAMIFLLLQEKDTLVQVLAGGGAHIEAASNAWKALLSQQGTQPAQELARKLLAGANIIMPITPFSVWQKNQRQPPPSLRHKFS